MEGLDLEVLRKAQSWHHSGRQAVLVTVVRTWGSSPRPPGSLLVLRDDGHAVGSVSGGCIEDDLIDRIVNKEGLPTKPQLVQYGVGAEEARRFGLPCGGRMELVLEPITAASRLDELIEHLQNGRLVERILTLASGAVTLTECRQGKELAFDGNTLKQLFGPQYRLLLIGAGQLAQQLARVALALGFAVTVCDPRTEYSEEWNETGTTLTRDMPDDVVIAMKPDSRTAVIALTHDPKLDDLALMEALKTPAFYVAALGSRRNNSARRKRLLEFGVTQAQADFMSGPAGLDIGSRTPSEIAVSIAAELVARKNGIQAGTPVQRKPQTLQFASDEAPACG